MSAESGVRCDAMSGGAMRLVQRGCVYPWPGRANSWKIPRSHMVKEHPARPKRLECCLYVFIVVIGNEIHAWGSALLQIRLCERRNVFIASFVMSLSSSMFQGAEVLFYISIRKFYTYAFWWVTVWDLLIGKMSFNSPPLKDGRIGGSTVNRSGKSTY